MGRTHTDLEYEAELTKVREQLLLMGAKVEDMIAQSMRSLVERDSELARRMIETDAQINQLELEIDELCMRILARASRRIWRTRSGALGLPSRRRRSSGSVACTEM